MSLDAEDIICLRLLAIPAVVAIVDDRVYALILPQKGVLPAIRVQLITRDDPPHLRGTTGFISSRVQIDYFVDRTPGGDPLATAKALAAAAHGVPGGPDWGLAGWKGVIGGTRVDHIHLVDGARDFQGAELEELRVRHDYLVHYREG
jgi:hypothetical protein